MGNILDGLIIKPLKLIFEIIFSLSFRITDGSAGLSIVFLSFVLNVLLMPLYKKADEMQNKENEIQKSMKPDVDFIKKVFSGDEQYMMLQTYYRQHNYKPIYALRSSVSLLLQIPFFMAAYSFLSNLTEFENTAFGPIIDLSMPDHLFFGINILPVTMTIINIISCIVYTKGKPLKSRIQLYLMAFVFLVLLYNMPSALTFYYLLNNLFSLIKNVFNLIKDKTRFMSILGIVACLSCCLLINPSGFNIKGKILFYGGLLFIMSISAYLLIFHKMPRIAEKLVSSQSVFLLCSVFLAIVTGFLIPSSVIVASPEEFIDKTFLINPISYIFNAALLSFGLFVLWFNIFYVLLSERNKKIVNTSIWIICCTAVVDYMFFSNNFGTMSNKLVYNASPKFSLTSYLVNILIIILVALVAYIVWARKAKLARNLIIIMIVVTSIMSSINLVSIKTQADQAIERIRDHSDSREQLFAFSKNQRNVIVFMLDRAIGSYFPFLLGEKPELIDQFSGFTFYPNTISFGGHTNVGAPALFGGYEYTPEMINRRDTEKLVDKHNESLKVLPVLFNENGYDVTVCDPPFAGYSWISDVSIYKDYPTIHAYITEGSYSIEGKNDLEILKRDLFCFSLFKIAPVVFQKNIYDNGNYLKITSVSPYLSNFVDCFEVLKHLNTMTEIGQDKPKAFLMIQNSTTHEPIYLSEEDYMTPVENNLEYEGVSEVKVTTDHKKMILKGNTDPDVNQIMHYQINMAAIIQLGRWFDYLKANGVYDNTRIIIVSDHGKNLGSNEEMILEGEDLMYYNPLLLVKDFDSKEFKIDDSFMTNADVPYLATKDLIDEPINPFTGNAIIEQEKEGMEFHVFATHKWNTQTNNGEVFIDDKWFAVHDYCLNKDYWRETDNPNN